MKKLSVFVKFLLVMCIVFSTNAFAYHIAGTVYCDSNDDGVIGEDDILLSGVGVVMLSDIYGTFLGTTDANGDYYVDLAPQGAFGDIYNVSLDESTLGALAYVLDPAAGSVDVDLVTYLEADGVDFLVDDPSCGETQNACGNGILDQGEQCDDGNLIDGDGCSAMCTVEILGQGCTPGYWKQVQHFDSWSGVYTPDTLFSDVFENAFPGMTLLEVLHQGGGGMYALGRHAVAALLNSESSSVYYDMSASGVINAFNSVYPGSKPRYNSTKNVFQDLNEMGCPLN